VILEISGDFGVGILRKLINKLETSGAVVADDSDDPEPLKPALAAAEAAIEEAIRKRRAVEQRSHEGHDRRVSDDPGYMGPERRVGDRRKGGSFGRRTRA
jgi:hypothetical protein